MAPVQSVNKLTWWFWIGNGALALFGCWCVGYGLYQGLVRQNLTLFRKEFPLQLTGIPAVLAGLAVAGFGAWLVAMVWRAVRHQ